MKTNSIIIYGAVARPPEGFSRITLKHTIKARLDRIRYKLGNTQALDYRNYISARAYNKGDLAIAQATSQKVKLLANLETVSFVNWGRLNESLEKAPLLISGSGYIHLDENHAVTERVQNDLTHFSSHRSTYALHGVGVNMSAVNNSDIISKISTKDRGNLKSLIDSAVEISVRDKNSQAVLEEITGRGITIVADPALFIKPDVSTPLINRTVRTRNALTVGICLPFHGPAATMRIRKDLVKYIAFLKNLQAATNCNFIQTIHFDSEVVIGKIMQDHGIRLTQAVGDVQTLLDAYQQMDFHIGGMLHSCILSASVGTPCIGLAYDIKHQGFFDLLGQPDLCVPAEPFDPERLRVACERVIGQNNVIRTQINARRDELEAESNRFLARTLGALLV